MKKLKLLACATLACLSIRAQTVTPTVISAEGGYSSGTSGSIAWTIGEPVSETYKSTANITTMGFHQTEMELINMIGDNSMDPTGIVVFPNPVHSVLKVDFKGIEAGTYSVRITDAAGRQIMETDAVINAVSTVLTLQMNTVAEGNYILSVSGREIMKNIKINKMNN